MMKLYHLQYFIAVAEELSFRRAAERVPIDSTPLPRTIGDLEDQLGVLLFMRIPPKLHLTPAGARLLRERAWNLMRLLGLEDAEGLGQRYPHEVSDGQLQRMMTAMASCS
ncbi:hypothetical protein BOTU111921_03320 [Bordetella tumbae]|uniref:LysR family transcriptional regulator n=1 Tax=Bordetella tumbae TaxID=1649139 RepID=UPI0039EE0E28